MQDANLNDTQLALLAQNGFVVVPSPYQQFDTAYRPYSEDWDHLDGKAQFVTTDALLHTLFIAYQNALMFMETSVFYGDVANFLIRVTKPPKFSIRMPVVHGWKTRRGRRQCITRWRCC